MDETQGIAEKTFLGSTLQWWTDRDFGLGKVLQEWSLEEIAGLEQSLKGIWYAFGNLSFAICTELDAAKKLAAHAQFLLSQSPEVAVIWQYRFKIDK